MERITRNELLIEKIVEYLTELLMRVIVPEIFEMRVPGDLLPFVLAEHVQGIPLASPVDCLVSFDSCPSTSASDGLEPVDPASSESPAVLHVLNVC